MTGINTYVRLYVDTNVLINYCNGVKNDVAALSYIFSKRKKSQLFTSSLAIVQMISRLQTKTKSRDSYKTEYLIKIIKDFKNKFTIIDLSHADISSAIRYNSKDLEDAIHVSLCRKLNCECILTNNSKDFSEFDTPVLKPDLKVLKHSVK